LSGWHEAGFHAKSGVIELKMPQPTSGFASRLRSHCPVFNSKLVSWSVLFILFLFVSYLIYFWSLKNGIDSLNESGRRRLEVYVTSLENVLDKYDYLPKTLELNKDVFTLLQNPHDKKLVATVNQYLEQINEQAKSNVIYVIGLDGVTLAASNWNQPNSFVGINLSFRPYVQDALHHIPGRFYGIGTTSKEPGYYFAHGIYRNGKILGVAAVKISLGQLEKNWSQGNDQVMLVDENNVIFLSSVPKLKYKTIGRLDQKTIDRLNETHQYFKQNLDPIHFVNAGFLPNGTRVISIKEEGKKASQENPAGSYLVTEGRTMSQANWRFILLSDFGKVQTSAVTTGAFAVVIFGLLMFVFLYMRQRNMAIMQNNAAKEALQHAYDNLELMVAERTSALNLTTRNLTQEIAERYQAQQALQTTQNELIQAGKMAVLGQMSAGITHELNQPLTALHTLSDNALVLLERGNIEEARNNLSTIRQVIDRMGTITRQLKVFSRKSASALTSVPICNAITNAKFLVDRRMQLENVSFKQIVPDNEVFAQGDSNRLEQVLVNLFNNALDSMENSAQRCLTVEVHSAEERVFISVKDTGSGIPEEAMKHLFEPFFTTKAQGAGLGLGLVISAQIVREFGGTLSGANSPDGGALFTLELRAVRAGGQ
jgi:two-component system C4-dicarboxylate transport sensor histidine kinase DctB